MRPVQLLCTIPLILALPGAGASAQTDAWLAWQGCWRASGAPAGEYLCIVPESAAGVRMLTVAAGTVVMESRIIADGRARAVQTEGCDGSEVARWSADRDRVLLRSELTCEGGVTRHSSGIFAITGTDSWLSVQAVTVDDQTATRAVHYSAANDAVAPASVRLALGRSAVNRTAARLRALSDVDAADVSEAAGHVDAAAVDEWLSETGLPFQLADAAAGAVVSYSALDHAAWSAPLRQPAREVVRVVERPVEIVHVVERPVYVTRHVYDYNYRYRSCWDPFFAGVVLGIGPVSLRVGETRCSRSYITHYSPWGYDLHGWRVLHYAKPHRPVVHYREPPRVPRVVTPQPRGYDRYEPAAPKYAPPPAAPRTAVPRAAAGTSKYTPQPAAPRSASPTITKYVPQPTEPRTASPTITKYVPQPTEPRTASPTITKYLPQPTEPRAAPQTAPKYTPEPAAPRTAAPRAAPARGVTPPERAASTAKTAPPPAAPTPAVTRTAKPRGGGSEH